MDENGKGITQTELDLLPEVKNVVLWQPDDTGPIYVIDIYGGEWAVGFYKNVLHKSKSA